MYDAQSLKFETMAVAETQISKGDDVEDAPVQVEEDTPEVVEEEKTTSTSGGGGSFGWSWLLLSALLAACGRRRIIRFPV